MVTVRDAPSFYAARAFVILSLVAWVTWCFVWMTSRGTKGKWDDHDRFERSHFLCEKSNATLSCSGGWQFIDGRCYKHFDVYMSFFAAQSECQRNDANLAIVPSEAANKKLLEMCDVSDSEDCWIGLYQPSVVGGPDGWRWIADDSTPTYTNWHPHAQKEGDVAIMFTSKQARSSSFFPAACATIAILVVSAISCGSLYGAMNDNMSLVNRVAKVDCCCGGTFIAFAVVSGLFLNQIAGIITSVLAAIAMGSAFFFGCYLPEQLVSREELPSDLPISLGRSQQVEVSTGPV
eukprot:TRINITY_DN6854_c0_g2_i1.p1 TRINITY_DN6854_c0_g2~~TRINITY_DN6854_c0_g2_i1.p1  ORF type:complete len:313 (+),score=25.16 TRINITY_DN6854_c0_g2_i1:69-941(+)